MFFSRSEGPCGGLWGEKFFEVGGGGIPWGNPVGGGGGIVIGPEWKQKPGGGTEGKTGGQKFGLQSLEKKSFCRFLLKKKKQYTHWAKLVD